MNKVILVMNDPMFCSNCPLAKSYKHIMTAEEHWFCGVGHSTKNGDVFEKIDINSEARPDWCPLKPLPEKDTRNHAWEWGQGHQRGWNQCIDKILGN